MFYKNYPVLKIKNDPIRGLGLLIEYPEGELSWLHPGFNDLINYVKIV